MIAASAVDFPDPVTPVTSPSPRGRRPISSSTGGRFRSWIVLTSYGMARKATATVPRCWYTLVRNRPTPGTPIAKSASLCSANSFTCRGVMICSASDFNSSGLSGATSSATRSPFTLMVAGRPTLSSKSEPLRCTICVIACLKLNAGRLLCVASPMRIHPEKDLAELHRLRVLRGDLSNHACDLGFDLVHDLHGLDDADHLPHIHPAAHFDVGLRGGLGRLVERPHHRGLDLEQLRSGRGCRRLGSPRSARGAGRCCSGLCDNDMAPRPHSERVAMPSLRHPHRRPRAARAPPPAGRCASYTSLYSARCDSSALAPTTTFRGMSAQ